MSDLSRSVPGSADYRVWWAPRLADAVRQYSGANLVSAFARRDRVHALWLLDCAARRCGYHSPDAEFPAYLTRPISVALSTEVGRQRVLALLDSPVVIGGAS